MRVGTRGSALAMWQAHWVADRLTDELPGWNIELVEVRTRGDEHLDLAGLAGKGHFTSELEAALVDGRIDVAVHSLKDLPVEPSSDVTVAAVPARHDPSDALVTAAGVDFGGLPSGARVGTGSPRRACLIRALRPDLEVVGVRGNVDTRVRRVEEGAYDAVVLATAGLERLGLADRIGERFDPHDFPPAPGQGALAVQVREEESELHRAVTRLDDSASRETVEAERSLLGALGGGCAMPVGAHGWHEAGGLRLLGFVGSADGQVVFHINYAAAERAGLRIDSKLMRLARKVYREDR